MTTEGRAQKLESAARTIAESRPRHRSVLLVESDPDLQWSLARMLTVDGNRVFGTSSVDGALTVTEPWDADWALERGSHMITVEKKSELIGKFRIHETDTGSAEVQVAILTQRIRDITEQLKLHKRDHGTRRGLLKLVGRRSTLLKYLSKKDHARYKKVVAELGLRK